MGGESPALPETLPSVGHARPSHPLTHSFTQLSTYYVPSTRGSSENQTDLGPVLTECAF